MLTTGASGEGLTQATQRLLVSLHAELIPRLEGIQRSLVDSPPTDVLAAAPKIAETVILKVVVPSSCIPQPCQQGIQLLASLAAHKALQPHLEEDDDATGRDAAYRTHVAALIDHALPSVLQVLWHHGEEHPSLATSIERFVLTLYQAHASCRRPVRQALLEVLGSYVSTSSREKTVVAHSVVGNILNIMLPMYRGCRAPLHRSHMDDCVMYIAPLLRNPCSTLNASIPAVDLYIGTLCAFIRVILSKTDVGDTSWFMVRLFRAFLPGFQEGQLHASAAVVASLSRLTDDLDGEAFDEVLDDILSVCERACASDYPPIATKALQWFQQPAFQALARKHPARVMDHMAMAMVGGRSGDIPWDAGVRQHVWRCWQLLDSWDAVDVVTTSANGSTPPFTAQITNGPFKGDAAAAEQYRAKLCSKYEEDESHRRYLEQQRLHRASFAEMLAAAKSRATRLLNFVVGRTLGSGAFGTVKYARLIQQEVDQNLWYEVALKYVSKSLVREQECELEVQRELALHTVVTNLSKGRFVAPLLHVFEDPKSWYLVMPYFRHGDLFEALQLGDAEATLALKTAMQLPKPSATRLWISAILKEVGAALVFLHHEARVFYGDLKPENVLLVPSATVVGGFGVALCDFGAAMPLDDMSTATQMSGTLEYCAPEVLRVIDSGTACDTLRGDLCDAWSFGCLVAQLLLGRGLFDGVSSIAEALEKQRRFPSSSDAIALPQFVLGLLELDPRRRLPITAALQDTFFVIPEEHLKLVQPPPRVVAGGTLVTRNSGRKESMMWKRANIDDVRVSVTSGADGSGLSVDEEPEGTLDFVYKPRRTVQVAAAASSQPPGAPGTMPRSAAAGSGGVSEYFTVMPSRR